MVEKDGIRSGRPWEGMLCLHFLNWGKKVTP